jgi:hypothetical protein
MTSDVTGHRALPADGFTATWSSGDHDQHLTLRWENEAWTATGALGAERAEYVLRITAQWQVSQFLLFRDLDEADLWLGTDGHGRWGEVNGAHRTDLDGGTDIVLACSPFSHAVPIRRLPLAVGDAAELSVLHVDVETLGVVTARVIYERVADRRWRYTHDDTTTAFEVDDYGIPLDLAERFRRQTSPG